MKEVIMIERTHGSMTPQKIADTLSRKGHLVAITPDSRYYKGDIGKGYKGYRVIYNGCIPVQVVTLDPQDVETLAKFANLKFGDF